MRRCLSADRQLMSTNECLAHEANRVLNRALGR